MSGYGVPVQGARWPTSGTLGFGNRRSGTHTHQGLDFGAAEGRPVLAVANGTVEQASNAPLAGFGGYGRVVVLRFDDVDGTHRALYAHLRRVDVRPGDVVRVGQKLGEVGRSQFRSAAALRRAGITPPAGYRPEMDEDGRFPARGRRPMGAHLHFELANAPYPMTSEAPHRIDPVAWAAARGLTGPARSRETQSRQGELAQASRPPTAGEARFDRLRSMVVAELGRTEPQVALALTRLRASGAPMAGAAAGAVSSAWETFRNQALAAVGSVPDSQALERAIRGWLESLARFRDRARDMGVAPLAEIAERLRRRWEALLAPVQRLAQGLEEGFQRASDTARQLKPAAMLTLLVLGVVMLSSSHKQGRKLGIW